MAEDEYTPRHYHTPVTQPEHWWTWEFLLYPKKAGPPLRFLCDTKRQCYETWDSLPRETQAKYAFWEIAYKVV